MPITNRARLTAPTPLRSRTGLLDVAQNIGTGIPAGEVQRWQGGISYRPLGSLPLASGATFDPCDEPNSPIPDESEAINWDPWGIVLADECSALSTDEDTEASRALNRLETQTSHFIERTFWTGEVGENTFAELGWDNRPLASPLATVLTSTGPLGVVPAFGDIYEYLADTLGGQRGFIHVEPKLLAWLVYYRLVTRQGNTTLTTVADHIVVAGSGYPGTAPDGSDPSARTTWVYVTSPVRAGASQPQTVGYTNRETNDVEAYAYRMGLAEWDLEAHAAVEVCIPDPGPTCVDDGS